MPHAIRIHQTGGPEVLQWEEVEVGEPGPGQVKLRQEAAGPQLHRRLSPDGAVPAAAALHPRRRGSRNCRSSWPRRRGRKSRRPCRLCGADRRLCRGAADRCRTAGETPGSISSEQAAGMMLQGMTAHMLLRSVHRVTAGETILIHAAAGGVGLIVCQWAKALGATVIGTVWLRREGRARPGPRLRPPDRLHPAGLRRRGEPHHQRREASGRL